VRARAVRHDPAAVGRQARSELVDRTSDPGALDPEAQPTVTRREAGAAGARTTLEDTSTAGDRSQADHGQRAHEAPDLRRQSTSGGISELTIQGRGGASSGSKHPPSAQT
jgi:hypothetical protein